MFAMRKRASVFAITTLEDVLANAASTASSTSPPAHVSGIYVCCGTDGKFYFLSFRRL